MWDFRAYHVRAINAATETEKTAINQELKEIYEGLDEAHKQLFNAQLQTFLMKQYQNLADDYEQIKKEES
jgi:hypothetical protein